MAISKIDLRVEIESGDMASDREFTNLKYTYFNDYDFRYEGDYD